METKEEYLKKLELHLKEWSAKIDGLEAKARRAEAEARIRYSNEIEKLRTKRLSLQNQLSAFRNASGEALKAMRSGIEKAASDLKDALDEAISKFK